MFSHPSRRACVALALLASVGLASCRQAPPPSGGTPRTAAGGGPRGGAPTAPAGKSVRIGIITNTVSSFWDPMAVGMERANQEFGCQATWKGPQHGDVAEQRRILEDYVSQGVDGIAISPADATVMTPVLKDLQSKGILVLTIDSDAPKSGRKVYIGTNNYTAGRAAGDAALKILGDKAKGAKVVAFVGKRGAPNAQERLRGFIEATSPQGVKVLDVREDNTDQTRARQNAETAIQAFPDATLFLGLWAYNGPAIAQAVKAAGKRPTIKVVCFDAQPQTLEHLEAGEVDATVVQKPYQFGYLAVKLIHQMKTDGVEKTMKSLPSGDVIDTGVEVVTPQSVKQYREGLKKLGIKSS